MTSGEIEFNLLKYFFRLILEVGFRGDILGSFFRIILQYPKKCYEDVSMMEFFFAKLVNRKKPFTTSQKAPS